MAVSLNDFRRQTFKRYVCPYKLIYRDGPPKMVISINEEFIERPHLYKWGIHRAANKNKTLAPLADTPNSVTLIPSTSTPTNRRSLDLVSSSPLLSLLCLIQHNWPKVARGGPYWWNRSGLRRCLGPSYQLGMSSLPGEEPKPAHRAHRWRRRCREIKRRQSILHIFHLYIINKCIIFAWSHQRYMRAIFQKKNERKRKHVRAPGLSPPMLSRSHGRRRTRTQLIAS